MKKVESYGGIRLPKQINTDIIPVYEDEFGEKVVLGRDLHEKLRVALTYKMWIEEVTKLGFAEDVDYSVFRTQSEDSSDHPFGIVNHRIGLEMAKHLALLCCSPRGQKIRLKLIEVGASDNKASTDVALRDTTAQKEHARAELINAQSNALCTIMEALSTGKLSALMTELSGRKSEEATSKTAAVLQTDESTKDPAPVTAPVSKERPTFSATEIGNQVGLSPTLLGMFTIKHGLRRDEYAVEGRRPGGKTKKSPEFRYYANVVPVIKDLLGM